MAGPAPALHPGARRAVDGLGHVQLSPRSCRPTTSSWSFVFPDFGPSPRFWHHRRDPLRFPSSFECEFRKEGHHSPPAERASFHIADPKRGRHLADARCMGPWVGTARGRVVSRVPFVGTPICRRLIVLFL